MKKLILLILLLMPMLSRADHGAGVDIFYTHIRDSTYRISMIIYGNCTDRTDYLKLFNLHPQVDIYDNQTKKSTLSLNIVPDSTRNASPYCKKQQDSTSCIITNSPIQGFTRIYYADTVTLPYKSSRWVFRFNGSLNTNCQSRLGRPGALSNYVTVPAGASNNMTVDATLNNMQTNINSSAYSLVSTIPLYCVNVPGVYSQQTTDPNGDSLVYEVFTPRNMNNSCVAPTNLAQVNGYNPLHVVPGSYNFNTNNGRMTFTPDMSQMSIISIRISEYRNGQLIGSVERERIFKILGNCNNQPPVSHIDTSSAQLSGATVIGIDSLFACPGNKIKFNIPVSNPYGDTVNATVEQFISGSSVVILNNNTTTPRIQFEWNTAGVVNGTYTFYARFFTNSCPLPSTSLTKYTIIVSGAGDAKTTILSATNCVNKSAIRYDIANGRPPYEVTISKGGNLVNSFTSTTGIIDDSLTAGDYQIKIVSQGLPCVTNMDFKVVDSGVYPVKPTVVSPIDYCRNAEAKALIATGDTVATLTWYDPNQQVFNGVPAPSTTTAGTYYWYVSNKYKTCESEKDSIKVVIDQAECDYDVTVYNVITPNGDGKNDRWMVKNTQYYPNMLVQVFNKLGDKVYERRGYNNEWDGDNLPSGTYYYVVRTNGINKTSGKEIYTGYLLIKR